jgi:penicillin-binding protein 1A
MLTPFVVSVVIILMVSQGFFGKLPTFDELENPKTNLATQLISSDGNNLGAYFYENRSNVSYKELPNDLIDALIATEDIRFRNHSGFCFHFWHNLIFSLLALLPLSFFFLRA